MSLTLTCSMSVVLVRSPSALSGGSESLRVLCRPLGISSVWFLSDLSKLTQGVQHSILTFWTSYSNNQTWDVLVLSFRLVLHELLSCEELLLARLSRALTPSDKMRRRFFFQCLTKRAAEDVCWKYLESSWQDQLDLQSFLESRRPGWRSSCCC